MGPMLLVQYVYCFRIWGRGCRAYNIDKAAETGGHISSLGTCHPNNLAISPKKSENSKNVRLWRAISQKTPLI